MGSGYIIGCIECIKEEDLNKIWCNENPVIKGTFFDIQTGGVMLLFCKEQLEKVYGINKNYNRDYRLLATGDPPDEIYKTLGSATYNEIIDKKIYDNLKTGYDFTEILGDLPYYCENCKKLFSRFYFQMKKGEEMYIPDYNCPKCNYSFEPACPTWEKLDGMGWAKDLEEIKFKINIFNENGLILLKSIKDEEKKLICDNCGNEKFSILSESLTD